MSIVRVGLAETKGFAEGYEAIFGKKTEKKSPPPAEEKKTETPASPMTTAETKSEAKK